MSDPEFGALHAAKLVQRLENELEGLPIDVLSGEKVIEVRPRGVNKGVVAASIIAGRNGSSVLAMGDDRTDEDLFAALPESGISIHVGPRSSRAHYRLADMKAARDFLRSLL